MDDPFVQLIDESLGAAEGEVVDRSRAIDRLLDLRNEAHTPGLVDAVDGVLSAVPGRTMVTVAWWTETLEELRLAAIIEAEKTTA